MTPVSGSIPAAAFGARVISSSINFATNRSLVFSDRRGKHLGVEAAQYWALVVVLLVSNISLLSLFTHLGLSLLAAKVITDVVLDEDLAKRLMSVR